MRLLPVPGPPVSTLTPDSSTCATAACCAVSSLGAPSHASRVGDPLGRRRQPGDRLGHHLLGHAVARPGRAARLVRVRPTRRSCSSTSPDSTAATIAAGRVADALGLQRGDDQAPPAVTVCPSRAWPPAARARPSPGPGGCPAGRPRRTAIGQPVGVARGRRRAGRAAPTGRRAAARAASGRARRRARAASLASRPAPTSSSTTSYVGLARRGSGEQPPGPLPADLRDLHQPVGRDVVGRDDAGAAAARPQSGGPGRARARRRRRRRRPGRSHRSLH